IDFHRAFDLLWIDGLLIKLIKLGISGNMFTWIKNFLTDRKYQVKIEDTLSDIYSTENGTPQGSVLSPLLFLIMVNDFPQLSKYTDSAFFADDGTIWRSGMNLPQVVFHLQEDLNVIGNWCNKWGFVVNIEKTTGILFTRKKIKHESIILKMQGKAILFKNSVTLLGVVFDNRMTWEPHISNLVDKTKNCLNL